MYKKAYEYIQKSDNIVLISHVNPDGDAIGSSLALFHVLKKAGKKVSVVNVSEDIQRSLDFLPGFSKIRRSMPKKCDLLISLDSGSFERLGIDKPKNCPIVNFDHHISNTHFGDVNIVEPDFASTSEVIYRFLETNGIEYGKDTALCIYTAIVTDTGYFCYEKVTQRVFETAAKLVKKGVDPHYVAKMLRERESLAKLRLTAKILDTLTLFLDAKVAVVRVTQEMFKETGAVISDAENASNMARSLATVEVGVLLREEKDSTIKVSLRSKNYVDVSKIAKMFGGGGHKRAAGYAVKDSSFEKVLENLLKALREEIKN
ncbi:DHH family phosphoesterase [Nitrosophilus alvini]|uniref:DHH family phosphoesterase n=1 Tax=Nitrosophilus alvini TaxID=2714855 RepID=UPI00190AF339|nr:bifunctional oligoribonuclease/PAP phosphatase NrnA [Nitrosophilus alvini]